jgi:hypothetical protein
MNNQQSKGYWMFKAPKELKVQMDRIRVERIKLGKDKEMRSYGRLGLAMARHERLINDIINSDFIGDKK